ncbi:hypothetical protein ABZ379_37050 [Streptomyces canus]|uniref:hypothetical protein n=1 Tax=Streptomyces canus TaxID=58343 RepID=UPI0033F97641
MVTPEADGPDPRLELAYDAILTRLRAQNDYLVALRNRATGLLTIAALIASFSSGLGLINTDRTKGPILPTWAPWSLLGTLVFIGIMVMSILWPVSQWHYGPNAAVILEHRDMGRSENDIREYVTKKLVAGRDVNQEALTRLANYFRAAVFAFTVEVTLLVIALATRA